MTSVDSLINEDFTATLTEITKHAIYYSVKSISAGKDTTYIINVIKKLAVIICANLGRCQHRNATGDFCCKPVDGNSKRFCKLHLEKTITNIIKKLYEKRDDLSLIRYKMDKKHEEKYGPLYAIVNTNILVVQTNRSAIGVIDQEDYVKPLTLEAIEKCKELKVQYSVPLVIDKNDEKKLDQEAAGPGAIDLDEVNDDPEDLEAEEQD